MAMSLANRFVAALRAFRGARAYFKGAEYGRLTQDWILGPVSADKTVRYDLVRLRERCRQLARDNSYVIKYLKTCSVNIAGPDGIRLQAQVRNNGGKLAATLNEKIETAWEAWACGTDRAGRKTATADGTMTLAAFQQHIVELERLDGECFIRMIPGFDNEWGFALQVIDPDMIDERLNVPASAGQNRIVMGIEMDQWRRRVAYHVLKGSPTDEYTRGEHERIPADQIIHYYRPGRANQTRGVPSMAAAISDLRHLDGYIEAELIAARTGAAKMGFFSPPVGSFAENADETKKPMTMDANPGVLEELPPGYTFSSWTPDHPAAAFPNFVKTILRRFASGVGTPYVKIANDLEGVNYSSIRQGELDARDEWRGAQRHLSQSVMQRIYQEWLRCALLSGYLVLDSRDPTRFMDVKWVPRGWSWVDPLKDVQAALLAVEGRLSTRTAEVAETGDDFEETLEQLAEEEQLMKDHGLEQKTMSIKKTPPPTGSEPITGAVDGEPGAGAQETPQ